MTVKLWWDGIPIVYEVRWDGGLCILPCWTMSGSSHLHIPTYHKQYATIVLKKKEKYRLENKQTKNHKTHKYHANIYIIVL